MNITINHPCNAYDYYVATVDGLIPLDDPYCFKIVKFQEIDAWCEKTFGPSDLWGETPVTGWKRMRNQYFFVSDQQLTWFVMQWS